MHRHGGYCHGDLGQELIRAESTVSGSLPAYVNGHTGLRQFLQQGFVAIWYIEML